MRDGLGIGARVSFLGSVLDMQAFYRNVDCLVHPPLTEAFGLVAIEAAALGCPVIAAAIDGLPEAVADGVTGYTITPTLPLAEYEGLGGARYGLPALVYDPASDSLVAPPIVDPSALAGAVARLRIERRLVRGAERARERARARRAHLRAPRRRRDGGDR